MDNEQNLENRADKLVSREVLVCLSGLVDEFMQRDPEGFLDAHPELVSQFVEDEQGEEEYLEIFEYWAVSSWLAEKLEAKGEKVEQDFYGLCVWGRTCTGQSISMDHVMKQIVKETGYAENWQ
ncbi:MAG: hypothetical protein R3E57_07285 [Porticoccaceae bacterium]